MSVPQPRTDRRASRLRRLLRIAAGWLFLATVLFGVWTEENHRGARAWECLREEYAASGQPLDLNEWKRLRGEARLDDQNLFGTPLLKPLFNYIVIRDRNGLPVESWVQYDEVAHAQSIRLPVAPMDSGRFGSGAVNLEYWQSIFRSDFNFPLSAERQAPAQDVLAAVARWDAELRELELASRRPNSRLPLGDNAAVIGLVHPCAVLRHVSEILLLRCAAHLELGDSEAALRDLEFNERLGRILASDDREFCHVAGEGLWAQGGRMVWEGLRRHGWDRAQLAQIDVLLGARQSRETWWRSLVYQQLDQCRDLQRPPSVMMGELKESAWRLGESMGVQAGLTALQAWQVFRGKQSVKEFFRNATDAVQTDFWRAGNLGATAVIACTPGLRWQNVVASVREWEPQCQVFKAWVRSSVRYRDMAKTSPPRPREWWSVYRSPHFSPHAPATAGLQRAADTECMTRMARIACAVERYRLERLTLPGSLSELVPDYLPELPRDTFTDADFIYVRLPGGQYRLDSPYQQEAREKNFMHWPTLEDTNSWFDGHQMG